jgi:hypothetical protein
MSIPILPTRVGILPTYSGGSLLLFVLSAEDSIPPALGRTSADTQLGESRAETYEGRALQTIAEREPIDEARAFGPAGGHPGVAGR